MIATTRYLAMDVLRGQRFLAPVLVYCGVLGMLFLHGDAGPALQAYAGSCALIYPVAAWLAVVIATSEDPARREITVVTAGGWRPVLSAVALLSVLTVIALSLLATLMPLVTNPHPYSVGSVLAGFAGHVVCGTLGASVGLLFARPVLRTIGRTVLVVFAVIVLTYPLGKRTPFGWVLDMLGTETVNVTLLWSGMIAAVMIVGAVALGLRAARR
ncbi:hypothetical protein Lesp02_81690 [Lentzea sp. NBRC 105346]|uniref:hypothetical protein n=1 Tax=Lentzea sp. NBRC 105346 TaxID=3032205 RepID=UPI0024A3C4C9|nr:hypothetical protein [Lentzea sp. NBRC 105346]GLZ35982.1 hypothetical protein Lesp02_81690 [Lentzea sp. NBRC 105346]